MMTKEKRPPSTRGLPKDSLLLKRLKPGGDLSFVVHDAKDHPDKFFLGIRDKQIALYLLGGKMLTTSETDDRITVNWSYLEGCCSGTGEARIPLKEWHEKRATIESQIQKIQWGGYVKADGKTAKRNLERIAVQQVSQRLNANPNSPYFYIDTEYTSTNTPYARFDALGISRRPDPRTGQHRIQLVEYKHGTGAYHGWPEQPVVGLRCGNRRFPAVENNPGEIEKMGSGIVGHHYDFLRFLFGSVGAGRSDPWANGNETPLRHLIDECYTIIENKRVLEIPMVESWPRDRGWICEDPNDVDVTFLLLDIDMNSGISSLNTQLGSRYSGRKCTKDAATVEDIPGIQNLKSHYLYTKKDFMGITSMDDFMEHHPK